MLYQDLCKQQ
ncbi:hypothetical protein LINGRAHAP2_LOCUS7371 [Linum grandiflorum]